LARGEAPNRAARRKVVENVMRASRGDCENWQGKLVPEKRPHQLLTGFLGTGKGQPTSPKGPEQVPRHILTQPGITRQTRRGGGSEMEVEAGEPGKKTKEKGGGQILDGSLVTRDKKLS